MESESFERLMKMISCFLCSTWIGKSVTAVTSYSSLTASRMLAVVDRTYDWLGLTTGGGRTRKQTLRHHGLVRSSSQLFEHEMGFWTAWRWDGFWTVWRCDRVLNCLTLRYGFELFDIETDLKKNCLTLRFIFELFNVQISIWTVWRWDRFLNTVC